jgi:tRNA/tmRNA/rRNA uracil-C5-methylase (TrmA/RlmC/RlmD family)
LSERKPAIIESGRVDALNHEGEGVVRAGKTVFVGGSLPGELVSFIRRRHQRQHDEAELVAVLEPASGRVTPRCAHFGVCGGCALQHLDSAAQLTIKEAQLRDSLERIGRVAPRVTRSKRQTRRSDACGSAALTRRTSFRRKGAPRGPPSGCRYRAPARRPSVSIS